MGALLLGQVDRRLGLVRRFAQCFSDRRDPRYVEHQVETLLGQRIFGLVLGYEDLTWGFRCQEVFSMEPPFWFRASSSVACCDSI